MKTPDLDPIQRRPKAKLWSVVLVLTLLDATLAAAASKPLFDADATLKLRIEAPFDDLIRTAQASTKPYDATITILEPTPETYPISLSARGISRRSPETCDFPPLRIDFKARPAAESLFRGQKSLKLATHCRKIADFQNYNLLEYAAFRLLNVLTPVSFRVRLAEIDYMEVRTGSVRAHRYAYFIEDVDELAARNGLKEVKTDKIERAQLNAAAVARSDLFQYMIGNQDWSDRLPTSGRNCCHNVKLLAASGSDPRDIIPVAYDFDSSGFVDTPYALPPVGVPIPTVRVRNYRGLCQFNADVAEAAHDFLGKRTELLSSLDSTPYLADRSKRSSREYLEGFFNEISSAEQIKRHILDKCRN
jgi:hypothetical protein